MIKEIKDAIAKHELDVTPDEESFLGAYLNPDLPCFLNARAAAQGVGLPSVEGLRIEAKFSGCLVAALNTAESVFPFQKSLVLKSLVEGLRPMAAPTFPAFQNPITQDAHREWPCTFALTALDELSGNSINSRTIRNLRCTGEIPNDCFFKDGKKVIIHRDRFLAWWESRLLPAGTD